jgi:hypothetical protein
VPDRMTFRDPLICWVPIQAPLAVHAVALVALQVRVADCPGSTELGFIASVICVAGGGVGGGGGVATGVPDPQPERTKMATNAKKY